MSPEQAKEKFGTEKAVEINSYDKASAAIYYQHLALLPDLFEICRFIFGLGAGTKSFSYENLTELYTLATGITADEKHMLTVAERIYNLERAFACREGFDRKDDHLVGKWAEEPVPNGPYKGEMIDPVKWEIMLDDYYRLRGWDNNGIPGRKKLTELGLESVADELEKLNLKTN
jgi:aldehyde:ferredoxin oxidoreductase